MIGEHIHLKVLSEKFPRYLSLAPLVEVETDEGPDALYRLELYDRRVDGADLPVLGLFAGVHGLEFVGVRILVAFVEHLMNQVQWNAGVAKTLRNVRIVGIPVVNPSGFVAHRRSNGNGVDLMRNAPVAGAHPKLLVGGQGLSRRLPYYKGDGAMELEAATMVRFVEDELWPAPFSLSLDLHSGFGVKDFLWTPYARQYGYPPTWGEYIQLKAVLKSSLKYFKYKLEPQSAYYCADGDLWDHLYDRHLAHADYQAGQFLPLTLEVGTWRYVKKFPLTGLRLWNYFNPGLPDPFRKVVHQHLPLLTLLTNVVANHERVFRYRGLDVDDDERERPRRWS